MVKAIILDVDGVIVGDKIGINLPLPHKEVIKKFRELREKGIPIILCTARFNFGILEIIKQARLNNPHITDGGALILDPLDNRTIKKHVIEKALVVEFVNLCLEKGIYIEIYTPEEYFLDKTQVNDFTKKRTLILQKEPAVVDSLLSIAEAQDIIKITTFVKNDSEMPRLEEIVDRFEDKINFIWSSHSFLTPARAGVITSQGVSKKQGAKEVAENLGLSFDDILGIGDTAGDWNFMQECGYVATLENGDEEIKTRVKEKGDRGFIAPHINDNGILDIFKFFSL